MTKLLHRCTGWLIHLFTASGACVGALALWEIYQHHFTIAFWLMALTIIIDVLDGIFARSINIKQAVPEIDGALLDNIVDFLNYTIVPCFVLLVSDLLPENWRMVCVSSIILAAAYQFTQIDAKTSDHFFKGFPSYWNISVFYIFFMQTNALTNLILLLTLAFLSFIPIKYVYPTRLEYLTSNKYLRFVMLCISLIWGAATLGLLFTYPEKNHLLMLISGGYTILYLGISVYRTLFPLSHLNYIENECES